MFFPIFFLLVFTIPFIISWHFLMYAPKITFISSLLIHALCPDYNLFSKWLFCFPLHLKRSVTCQTHFNIHIVCFLLNPFLYKQNLPSTFVVCFYLANMFLPAEISSFPTPSVYPLARWVSIHWIIWNFLPRTQP